MCRRKPGPFQAVVWTGAFTLLALNEIEDSRTSNVVLVFYGLRRSTRFHPLTLEGGAVGLSHKLKGSQTAAYTLWVQHINVEDWRLDAAETDAISHTVTTFDLHRRVGHLCDGQARSAALRFTPNGQNIGCVIDGG